MINVIINKFIEAAKRGQAEIYNEFSLQHELGIFIRSLLLNDKVQFERNISYFFKTGEFIKKEIDIAVFSPDRSKLRYAIELKFPRNGQYPEQMFSFCKDICFAEQLKRSGFEHAFLLVFADDPLFYSGDTPKAIYEFFRQKKMLYGSVQKPCGKRDEVVKLTGTYQIEWKDVVGRLKYTIIEANNSDKSKFHRENIESV